MSTRSSGKMALWPTRGTGSAECRMYFAAASKIFSRAEEDPQAARTGAGIDYLDYAVTDSRFYRLAKADQLSGDTSRTRERGNRRALAGSD